MRSAAGLGTLCCLLLAAGMASAEGPAEPSGLRGGRHVGSALGVAPAVRAAASAGYAFTESVIDGSDRHHRGFGELGGAYTPSHALQVALLARARYDGHRSAQAGRDRGGAFGSALTFRSAHELSRHLGLGAQARLVFPPAEHARRGLSALSPELSFLASTRLPRGLEGSLQAGYRRDRSARAVADDARLSAADRLALGTSQSDAVLLGALLALTRERLITSLEWSWDVLVGASAPSPGRSPMRVRVAAQVPLARRCLAGVELGIVPSARPAFDTGARIEPRVWAALSLQVALWRARSARRAASERAPGQSATSEAADAGDRTFTLRVVDARGAPVPGAEVRLLGTDAKERATDRDGLARVARSVDGAQRMSVSKAGFRSAEVELPHDASEATVIITLARELPEGEIKGKVRSLPRAHPLSARVRVEPLGLTLDTDARGEFSVAVPPGRYTLVIEADEHEPQRRPARVEQRGVTIVVVDLRRAPR